MGWKDKLPPGAPKPKAGETMRRYLLRMMREEEEKRIADLSKRIDRNESAKTEAT